ncbi:MAG: 1-acyl-sn-glycerol-3-phosphate acyltransferase [Acidobacteria bacterium]|nr:1-acyl-sn-glycerol-3-phosphate acyltransferase [Acidobacteriota bacterium]
MKNSNEQSEILKNPESVQTLRLWQMIYLGKGTIPRQLFHAFICVALRLFFRRIEASGVEKVPREGAIIFVLNHPNGAVDPGLVFVSLPRRVSFLAKSTLFDMPVGGHLFRLIEALPVYRRIDAGADIAKNQFTFENCEELLAKERCIAVFPEGISHDSTKLQPIKTGTARIALGALAIGKDNNELVKNGLKIMAVGLYYTSKTAFRSEALIRYGEIFEVEPVELDEDSEPPRDEVLRLTKKIETALENVTLNLENTEELETVLKAEALFSSVYENLLFKQNLTQSFLRLQEMAEKYKILEKDNPEKMRELSKKVEKYENKLKSSGVSVESLSVLQHPTAYVFRYLILRIVLLLLLLPLSIVGAFIHSPAYLFSNLAGLLFKKHGVDDAGSTYKILAACLFMPLTWLIVGAICFYFFGWQIALAALPVVIFCGYVALRSSEILIDMRVWIKSAWLLFRQRALFLRLLVQRENLQKEIGEIIEK